MHSAPPDHYFLLSVFGNTRRSSSMPVVTPRAWIRRLPSGVNLYLAWSSRHYQGFPQGQKLCRWLGIAMVRSPQAMVLLPTLPFRSWVALESATCLLPASELKARRKCLLGIPGHLARTPQVFPKVGWCGSAGRLPHAYGVHRPSM